MSVTLIDLDPNTTPVQVTIKRTSGSGLDQNGVISSGLFGVNTVAYFDPNGATVGEGAELGYDGSVGRFFLSTGYSLDASNEHLMSLRESRFTAWRSLPVGTTGSVGRPARPWRPRNVEANPEHVGRPARPWRPLWAA